MSTYQYYTEDCALCGKEHPKRDLNKLFISFGHCSITSPKRMCAVCDDCLPELCEIFEITLPEEKIRPYKCRRYCGKCYSDVGARAVYCPYCGKKLKKDCEGKV